MFVNKTSKTCSKEDTYRRQQTTTMSSNIFVTLASFARFLCCVSSEALHVADLEPESWAAGTVISQFRILCFIIEAQVYVNKKFVYRSDQICYSVVVLGCVLQTAHIKIFCLISRYSTVSVYRLWVVLIYCPGSIVLKCSFSFLPLI